MAILIFKETLRFIISIILYKFKILLLIGFLVNFGMVKAQEFSFNSEFTILLKGEETNISEVLSKYIQFNSISGFEKDAGIWLKNLCIENGLFIHQMGEENGNYNFAASVLPLSLNLPNVIFLSHIDVVPPGDLALWTYHPFSGQITSIDVWGRGAFDNKGAAIMHLFSIIQFVKENKEKPIPLNFTLLSVSCEETNCDGGVKYVINNSLEVLNPVVVIGEGATELNSLEDIGNTSQLFGISTAHKRPLWIKLDISIETSGHGSVTPIEYANKELIIGLNRLIKRKSKAIFNELNVSLLKELGNMEKGITKFVLKNPYFFRSIVVSRLRKEPGLFALFSNTMTITSIDSDNPTINIIPNSATALLDCRLLPAESNSIFLDKLRKMLKNQAINISILDSMPKIIPSNTDNIFYSKLKKAVQDNYLNSKVIPIFLPNYNDTGHFRARGIQSYSIIPIVMPRIYMENIHNINERIPIEALSMGKLTYLSFIENCVKTESQ